MRFGPIYVAFAAAYFLSYLYRTANAVISPDLTRELHLNPASLGLLTGAYLLAFGLMQIPAGMLLDRFGPRRVEPVLLAVAAIGAIAFGLADSLPALVAARALIGAGVCVCLMAPLKGIAMWYPAERQPSLAGWMMVAGGLGALAATAPLEATLHITSWRTIFIVLGVATFVVALGIGWRVPDIRRPSHPPGFAWQWRGVRRIFANPRFWWIAPLAGIGMGSFMAIQGLWAVPWMIEVDGMTRAQAADRLLVLGLVIMAGYLSLGIFSLRLGKLGITSRHLFAFGFATHTVGLAAILLAIPGSYAWWSLYGIGAAVNVLAFTVLSAGFEKDLAARANTALNLLMFTGSFVAQWGIGVVAELSRLHLGSDYGGGLRLAFAVVLALDALALAWFAYGWRRHAPSMHAAAAI
ncbi:MAG TPA: MFS transporter [Casimicrobiaceae bacterium]|jgi:MFS family permease